MAKKRIFILSAGSMARETFFIYKDLGKVDDIHGFVVENFKLKDKKMYGKRVYDAGVIENFKKDSIFVCAIGSPLRKRWVEKLEEKGFRFSSVVHPSVVLNDSVKLASGCIICPGVVLNCHVKIGKHSIININSNINHDCLIGNFVTIGPGVNIAGKVRIGDESWIGIGVTIIHKIKIGKGVFIGAGAVVTNDIPDNMLALGVPAKPIRKLTSSDWKKLI